MFDKEEYWKNRKEGKRGQGEFNPIVRFFIPEHWQEICRKFTKAERKAGWHR